MQKANEHLKELCRKYNFFLINNCKFIKIRHLNRSGIKKEDKKESTVLDESIANDVESLFNRNDYKCVSVSIHNRNLQVFATEMQKITKGLYPKVFTNTFTPRNQPNYNLRHITCFKMPLVNSVYNGN